MYSVHGEFDLKETSTYYSDIMPQNTSGDENTYRKLHYKFTFRRKWQFYGQNLVCCTLLREFYKQAFKATFVQFTEKGIKKTQNSEQDLGFCCFYLR